MSHFYGFQALRKSNLDLITSLRSLVKEVNDKTRSIIAYGTDTVKFNDEIKNL